MDGAVADLRHAFRALTRNRAFGLVAVLVLAASVAINTLIFFRLEGVVLRPLPYGSPDRLVRIYDASAREPKFPVAIAGAPAALLTVSLLASAGPALSATRSDPAVALGEE